MNILTLAESSLRDRSLRCRLAGGAYRTALFFLLAVCAAGAVRAGTFNVNTTGDTHAANLVTGTDGSGNISLRSACEAANTQAGPHTVNLPAGTYTLTLGEIAIGNSTNLNTAIAGFSSATTVISQSTPNSRIFDVGIASNIQISVSNVTLQNGQGAIDGFGGSGIIAGGPGQVLSVFNCALTNNVSPSGKGNGGAIEFSAGGTLTIANTTFSGNQANDAAQGSGGAIDFFLQSNVSGSLSVSACRFTNNVSASGGNTGGGAIALRVQGRTGGTTFSASITNCTFTGNQASAYGGAVMSSNASTAIPDIHLNRFFNNSAGSGGSAVAQISGSAGTINAENNWWGCDAAPGGAQGCQTISGDPGAIDADPRIDLILTASPTTINAGSNSSLTVDVSKNSNGVVINPAVMKGLPVTFDGTYGFAAPNAGTISASFGATSSYVSSACPGNPNIAFASAMIDSGTQTAAITIVEPPGLHSCPANFSVKNDPDVCGATVTYTPPTASQGCPPPDISCVPPSGSVFAVGPTQVTCTASNGILPDAACSFTVTVADTQRPSIGVTVPPGIQSTPGQCGTNVTYTANVADNCPGATVDCVPASGSFFADGSTPVTCAASDAHGNKDTTIFTIIVEDTAKPVIICQGDTTVRDDPGECTAVVTFPDPTVIDSCPGPNGPSCTPASGSIFPVGSTVVTCRVFNAAGTGDSCSFKVTVVDSNYYRTGRYEDWAKSHDAKGKLKSEKRKPDKVFLKFNFGAPAAATGFTVNFDMPVSGLVTLGKDKLVPLDTPIVNRKSAVYTGLTIAQGDTFQFDGVGSKGKRSKVNVVWATSPKATKVVLTTFKRNDPGLPVPNYVNIGEELFGSGQLTAFPGGLFVGLPRFPKGANAVIHKKYTDVQKSMIKMIRGVPLLHHDTLRCLDTFTVKRKPISSLQKSLPPDKGNNALFAELLTLKMNVTASMANKFPVGLGELTFDDQNDPLNPFNGQMVDAIVVKADSLITCLPVFSKPTVPTPAELYGVLRMINSAFADTLLDTVSFSTKTVFRGARKLTDVPYLCTTPGAVPKTIADLGPVGEEVPDEFTLDQNYPNPFNPVTTMAFVIGSPSFVTLKVYDVLGREVSTLLDREPMDEGDQEVQFDGSSLASGIYFYRLIAEPASGDGGPGWSAVRKMVLVK